MIKKALLVLLLHILPFPTAVHAEGVFQPSAPFYGTFYYMWYQTSEVDGKWSYWNDHGNTPPDSWFSHFMPDMLEDEFDPAHELYSSLDYEAFKWQLSHMAEARIEVAIASWWGQERKEDTAFRAILHDFMSRTDNPYPHLRWSLYYEDEGFEDPSVDTLVQDLEYIYEEFGQSPYYLRIDGKPVVFVYAGAGDNPGTMMTRWQQAMESVGDGFYLVMKVYSGFASSSFQPSSWHQYAPANRYGIHEPYASYVSPGFWLDDGSPVRLERNMEEFAQAVDEVVAADTTWKLVETWNEWGEGTSVEPGTQVTFDEAKGQEVMDIQAEPFGRAYISILADRFPDLEQGLGDTPACRADINADGIVDLRDYSLLVANFFLTSPDELRADINADGIVDLRDYSLLVASFFMMC